MYNNRCEVLSNKEISCGIFEIRIKDGQMVETAKAGQFLHIKVCNFEVPLLRRPISICKIDKEEGILILLYQVLGQGTKILSQVRAGAALDVIGPVGNPFPIHIDARCAVVGGGIGIAPLLQLTSELGECDAYLGFRSSSYYKEEFSKYCSNVVLSTEDGSEGHKGYATDLLDVARYQVVYTCGPVPMMKRVAEICKANGVKCYVSVEERMGCGIGACLVCACKTKDKSGEMHYKKACLDGPIFDAEEVCFNE